MIAKKLRYGVISLLILIATTRISPGRSGSEDSPKSSPCSSPEHRQFDFWVGDWDAFDIDKSNVPVARLHVDRILDGCVLREDYQGADGHEGQSFSVYDASRKVWHQSWVTNRGELLILEGSFQDGSMVLSGVDHPREGVERHVRGTWNLTPDGVRESAVVSTDGGKTWNLWFDLVFRLHKP